jgi:hypothetical protein
MRLSAPVHIGPEAYSTSCTIANGFFFQKVNRKERGVDQSPHLALRLKKEYSYICTPPLGLHSMF